MASPISSATVRGQVRLPLRLGDGYTADARVFSFSGLRDGREHVALGLGKYASLGTTRTVGTPLVRVHSECLTGDVLGSQRCDCGPQLREAVERVTDAGGYLLYLRQEGRGIGLYNKLDAYALQDSGLDTYQANVALGFASDERDYTVAAQMLRAVGVDRIDLLTNNPDKVAQLEQAGIQVDRRLPTGRHVSPVNGRYLAAKALREAQREDELLDRAQAAGGRCLE
ncbi:MAG TPA: GTP cyclohydrolase II [Nocardioidaceae bacterium]|nr:GTP cyclohydrolase II [Nocardioidaceae bacterium]